MNENTITDDDLVKEIIIGPNEWKSFVNGCILEDNIPINLKRNCIFRGLSKDYYDLTPKSLRKDENSGKYVICEYLHENMSKDYHSTILNDIDCDEKELTLELQYRREFFILFRFLDWADKSGLKIPVNRNVRKLLHADINPKFKGYWPRSKYYEVIALAQHNGLPTCALDWAYDYKDFL